MTDNEVTFETETLKSLECFREKCAAVFPKEARPNNQLGSFLDSAKSGTTLDALNEAVASLPSALKAAGFDLTKSLQGLASEVGALQKVFTAMSQSPALHMTPAVFAAELTRQADVIAERRFQELKTSAAAENAWA